MKLRHALRPILLAMALGSAPAALAQSPQQAAANAPNPNHPGKAAYDKACASCHANPAGTRAATFETMTGLSAARLREVVSEGGIMAPMAASLSAAEINDLIGYLTSGQSKAAASWTTAMLCPADKRAVDVSKPAAFAGFTADPRATRSVTAKQSGLKTSQMKDLAVAWSVGFPQTQNLGVGAAVIGTTAFVNGGANLLALDTATGCAKWAYPISSRNTPTVASIGGRTALLVSTARGEIHAVDASNGQLIWQADGKPANGVGAIRGGVVVHQDKVIA